MRTSSSSKSTGRCGAGPKAEEESLAGIMGVPLYSIIVKLLAGRIKGGPILRDGSRV